MAGVMEYLGQQPGAAPGNLARELLVQFLVHGVVIHRNTLEMKNDHDYPGYIMMTIIVFSMMLLVMWTARDNGMMQDLCQTTCLGCLELWLASRRGNDAMAGTKRKSEKI